MTTPTTNRREPKTAEQINTAQCGTVKWFDSLSQRDFENGAVINELHRIIKLSATLQSRIQQLEGDVVASKAKVDNLMECLKSECEIERMAKDAAKKVLTEYEVEGDSYGVPNVATIVDLLVARHNVVGMGLDALRRENDTLRRALKIDPSEPHGATLEWVLAVNKRLREERVAHLAVIEKAKVALVRAQTEIRRRFCGNWDHFKSFPTAYDEALTAINSLKQ